MKKAKYSDIHEELVDACRQGNRKAQFELYNRYYKAMYNTALRITGDTAEAEDAMQEGFLNAFRKIETYREEVSVGAWLKKIVVNRALDAVKNRKSFVDLDQVPEIAENDDENDEYQGEFVIDEIKKALYNLPERDRVIVSLFLLEGYDHEEIAEIMGISYASSRTQYHRAKKRLQKELQQKRQTS